MNLEKPPTFTFFSLAEHGSKLLALLAAALLLMSVCYDYSYLLAVGLSFNEIPSLTAEHVRSALLWGPYVALIIFGVAFQELVLRRLEKGLSEEEIISRASPATRRFRNSSLKLTVPVLILAAVSSFLTSTDYNWMYMLFIPCWMVLATSIIRHKRMGARFNRASATLFGILPIFIVLISWYGYTQGRKLTSTDIPKWELTIRVGTGLSKHTFVGLRRFSTFAIAVDRERYASIIPNDAVLSARRLQKVLPSPNNLCRLFEVSCPAVAPAMVTAVPAKREIQAQPLTSNKIDSSKKLSEPTK